MNFQGRLLRLQQQLPAIQCDAFLIDDPINLYYMTGLSLSSGTLLVTPSSGILLVDNRYEELCKKQSLYSVILSDTTPLSKLLSSPEMQAIKTIGIDGDIVSYKKFHLLQSSLESSCSIRFVAVESPIKQLRMIKDTDELSLLHASAALCAEGFDYVCTRLKEGKSEIDVAIELEIFWKQRKGRNVAFEPIIAFGSNSSMPHYRAGSTTLKRGMAVLIDIGVSLNHYFSDMTRVVFFGEPHPKMQEIYAIVEEAHQQAIAHCRPGVPIGEIDQTARGIIDKYGYNKYFGHSTGHNIGLEIHEPPFIRNKPPYNEILLQPGMVFTIEPGIYLPGIGGVRIEDTIEITAQGQESLTKRSTTPLII